MIALILAVSLIICASESDNYRFGPDSYGEKGESFQFFCLFRRFLPHISVRTYSFFVFFFSLTVRWRRSLHFHRERSQSVVVASKIVRNHSSLI